MYAAFVDYFRTHRIAVSRWLAAAGLLALAFAESAWENTPVEGITFFAGVVLVGLATVGRLWCSVYISGYKDAALITVGPYSITRNPLYFFSGLGFVGLALATETLLLAMVIAALLALLTPPVVAQEERYLAERFGDAYAAYAARTPRFWPRLRQYATPVTWVVNPRILQRRLLGSLWFVWGVGFLEVIEDLHKLHVLPTLFRLY